MPSGRKEPTVVTSPLPDVPVVSDAFSELDVLAPAEIGVALCPAAPGVVPDWEERLDFMRCPYNLVTPWGIDNRHCQIPNL